MLGRKGYVVLLQMLEEKFKLNMSMKHLEKREMEIQMEQEGPRDEGRF